MLPLTCGAMVTRRSVSPFTWIVPPSLATIEAPLVTKTAVPGSIVREIFVGTIRLEVTTVLPSHGDQTAFRARVPPIYVVVSSRAPLATFDQREMPEEFSARTR